ncbi:hypothetical protein [Brevibacterium litoralis]|uniref:hypothetical protein n=1 Tax=Brevibacterium litoralis TaxID=3138935 RepID=UPI003D9AA725
MNSGAALAVVIGIAYFGMSSPWTYIGVAVLGSALAAAFVGQWMVGTRYPVGVITGVLGAPYLVYLVARSNRKGV